MGDPDEGVGIDSSSETRECKKCCAFYIPRENLGAWGCRIHSQERDPVTCVFPCCGLRSDLIERTAHVRSVFEYAPWSGIGCRAADHDIDPHSGHLSDAVAILPAYLRSSVRAKEAVVGEVLDEVELNRTLAAIGVPLHLFATAEQYADMSRIILTRALVDVAFWSQAASGLDATSMLRLHVHLTVISQRYAGQMVEFKGEVLSLQTLMQRAHPATPNKEVQERAMGDAIAVLSAINDRAVRLQLRQWVIEGAAHVVIPLLVVRRYARHTHPAVLSDVFMAESIIHS